MRSSLALMTPMKRRENQYWREAGQYTSNHNVGESRMRAVFFNRCRVLPFMVAHSSPSGVEMPFRG